MLKSVQEDPIAAAALAKFKMDPDTRAQLAPGVHKPVEGLIAFAADQIKVGKDVENVPNPQGLPMHFLAKILASKVNRQTFRAVLKLAVAVQGMEKEARQEILDETVPEWLQAELDAATPTTTRKGAITAKGLRFWVPTAAEVAQLSHKAETF
jgi:hypothetical protein